MAHLITTGIILHKEVIVWGIHVINTSLKIRISKLDSTSILVYYLTAYTLIFTYSLLKSNSFILPLPTTSKLKSIVSSTAMDDDLKEKRNSSPNSASVDL
ncbi:hypothetical protein EUGRSUZ_D00543 [Eucalyptus grandis]|uniref:Uncharacterized protein n=2 Tax=Eucalyptus grandis TaxID=71139 RepID=A0A059CCH1_EUCGR|nr:hypothetical protein EUGRSUZ_D00543 [Eucalyptus grandis]